MRTLFFELNGHPREVRGARPAPRPSRPPARAKADKDNLHHLGSPMPGTVVEVKVAEAGDEIKEGDKLIVLEAMKMEMTRRLAHRRRHQGDHRQAQGPRRRR